MLIRCLLNGCEAHRRSVAETVCRRVLAAALEFAEMYPLGLRQALEESDHFFDHTM